MRSLQVLSIQSGSSLMSSVAHCNNMQQHNLKSFGQQGDGGSFSGNNETVPWHGLVGAVDDLLAIRELWQLYGVCRTCEDYICVIVLYL